MYRSNICKMFVVIFFLFWLQESDVWIRIEWSILWKEALVCPQGEVDNSHICVGRGVVAQITKYYTIFQQYIC